MSFFDDGGDAGDPKKDPRGIITLTVLDDEVWILALTSLTSRSSKTSCWWTLARTRTSALKNSATPVPLEILGDRGVLKSMSGTIKESVGIRNVPCLLADE